MVLHNICIQHSLQWEIESPDGVEEDEMTLPLDPTSRGHSVVNQLLVTILINTNSGMDIKYIDSCLL